MKNKEYGSQMNLVDNMASNEDSDRRAREKQAEAEAGAVQRAKEKQAEAEGSLDVENKPKLSKYGGLQRQETLEERVLTPDEKKFLLHVERGDTSTAKNIIKAMQKRPNLFDINCVDPLGRSSLIIAVENENIDMIEMLLEMGIKPKDALLVAIREDYVDGVEVLLRYEEEYHVEGRPYSWEAMDTVVANFTVDITPLILAAHRNNYEILKMLLDRGATIPIPHDVKCSCDECVTNSADDSLKFSLARINAYRALASPSLISLSSKDPILTAFQLSDELKRLARAESQFREEYITLRAQVQAFVKGLLDQARTSYELEVILNHNPEGEPWQIGDFQTLERLKLAIEYKQKGFVAHPSVQQLLASIWYEGLPGFRRKNNFSQVIDVLKLVCMFPFNSLMYLIAPHSTKGKFMRNPFVKFISHSASYMCFLLLLALASQRIEHVIISLLCYLFPGTEWLADIQASWIKYERGSLPHYVECLIILWVQGLLWVEMKKFWKEGVLEYLKDLWNLADLFSLGSFMAWIGLRALAWLLVQKEVWEGKDPDLIWIPKEQWGPYEPQLLAEAMFGAGMIASYLKLVHILSINPYLGPLQIALGKMVIDIVKWLFLYLLVVFAFGCGMNQLLWYYSDLERQECYSLPGGLPDFENEPSSCVSWRRFANLWETSQSLFWASFGLVDLGDFELKGIKEFTRFWGLLMFGSYSVCNIIVLLNMLIAMMSNSYQLIHERSDMEWKYSRSKLWISYFNPGSTVPVPFNMIPSPKSIIRFLTCKKAVITDYTEDDTCAANERYYNVMKYVIRRYITSEQRKSADYSITEDDINEVRQDINSFKYELIDILRTNKMTVPVKKKTEDIMGRKSKNMERQIQKGFNINSIDGMTESIFNSESGGVPKDLFHKIVKLVSDKEKAKKRMEEGQRRSSLKRDPIGSTETFMSRHRSSLKKSLLQRGNSQQEIKMVLTRLNSEELVAFNPNLSDYNPATRKAYAKFRAALDKYNHDYDNREKDKKQGTSATEGKKISGREGIRKLVIEKAKSMDSKGSMDSTRSAINRAVADLEKVIDSGAKEHQDKSAIKAPSKVVDQKQDAPQKKEESNMGSVNQGFTPDEMEFKVLPPSQEGSITYSMKEASAMSTPESTAVLTPRKAVPQNDINLATYEQEVVNPSPPGEHHAAPTQAEPPAVGAQSPELDGPPKPARIKPKAPSPKPPSELSSSAAVGGPSTSPRPHASHLKPKEPPTPGASPGSSPTPARSGDDGFDPNGKSAVSGQKRTGWI